VKRRLFSGIPKTKLLSHIFDAAERVAAVFLGVKIIGIEGLEIPDGAVPEESEEFSEKKAAAICSREIPLVFSSRGKPDRCRQHHGLRERR
jgi:hypothetical protein